MNLGLMERLAKLLEIAAEAVQRRGGDSLWTTGQLGRESLSKWIE